MIPTHLHEACSNLKKCEKQIAPLVKHYSRAFLVDWRVIIALPLIFHPTSFCINIVALHFQEKRRNKHNRSFHQWPRYPSHHSFPPKSTFPFFHRDSPDTNVSIHPFPLPKQIPFLH